MKPLTILLVALSATAAASEARAEGPSVAAEEGMAPTPRVEGSKAMWRAELGYRGSFVTSPGYGPFSAENYLAQVSLAASRTVFVRGRFSFAPGLAWDYGASTASARGDAASLTMHRLTVPLEGRVHFGSVGYAFLRVAPGVAMLDATVDDPSAPAALRKTRWLFATDASAGYAFPLLSRPEGSRPMARLWAQGEAGYGWVASERLNLAPDLPAGSTLRASGADLGSIAMRGAFFRMAVAVSF